MRMVLAKKTYEESLKPVSARDMAESGRQAEELSKSIQKQFGDKNAPVVGASPYARGIATDTGKQAEFARQQEFIPKAYEAAKGIEEKQTGIQDQVSDFWRGYSIRADEAAMKQNQAKRSADILTQEKQQELEGKLRDIEFSALQNDAQRQDALEKAYLDGQAEIELLKGGLAGAVKMSDIEKYWDLKINDIVQDLKDFEMWTQAEKEAFTVQMKADAANWGSIVNGLTTLGKVGAENWDSISTGTQNWWNDRQNASNAAIQMPALGDPNVQFMGDDT